MEATCARPGRSSSTVGIWPGTGSRKSCGLGVCRGLRPSFSRCDFVLLSNVKGFGFPGFFVAGVVEVEFGSPSAEETKEVSDFEGKEGAGLWAEFTYDGSGLHKDRLLLAL